MKPTAPSCPIFSNWTMSSSIPRPNFPAHPGSPWRGDPVHDCPPLVGPEAPHPLVENVNVVPSTSGEDESHRLLVKAEVRSEEIVVEMEDLQADRLEHLRVRHLRCVGQVVRIEIEDQVRSQPSFLLHRWGV